MLHAFGGRPTPLGLLKSLPGVNRDQVAILTCSPEPRGLLLPLSSQVHECRKTSRVGWVFRALDNLGFMTYPRIKTTPVQVRFSDGSTFETKSFQTFMKANRTFPLSRGVISRGRGNKAAATKPTVISDA
jgi:hypothetical protein